MSKDFDASVSTEIDGLCKNLKTAFQAAAARDSGAATPLFKYLENAMPDALALVKVQDTQKMLKVTEDLMNIFDEIRTVAGKDAKAMATCVELNKNAGSDLTLFLQTAHRLAWTVKP